MRTKKEEVVEKVEEVEKVEGIKLSSDLEVIRLINLKS